MQTKQVIVAQALSTVFAMFAGFGNTYRYIKGIVKSHRASYIYIYISLDRYILANRAIPTNEIKGQTVCNAVQTSRKHQQHRKQDSFCGFCIADTAKNLNTPA
jgi:hypothetical protein